MTMLYNWLKEISFAYPWLLGLLLLIPILVFWYAKKYNQQQSSINVSTAHAFTVSSWKNRFRHLPFVLRMLCIVCLVLTIARPRKSYHEQRTEGEGIDI